MKSFLQQTNSIKFCARAKYIMQADGSLRLAQVQAFSYPKFREAGDGWESLDANKCSAVDLEEYADPVRAECDVERATRRSKINAFDVILGNHDIDTFATFTYAPRDGFDKASYDECYSELRPWLSNRVQRRGLKYVIVPERHKTGAIHFHALMNSAALKLVPAVSPKGRQLTNNGNPLFNLPEWKHGFTSAELIKAAAEDRDKVAKYIFKYMGKQSGIIGGRYALIGGVLNRPVYVYGDSAEQLIPPGLKCTYDRVVKIDGNLDYMEYSFV